MGDPNDPNTQVGALISQQHWEKVSGYIRLGIEEGAALLAGADKTSDLPAPPEGGNFLRPTVLAGLFDNRMRVAHQEDFPGGSPACCRLKTKLKALTAWQTTWSTASHYFIWTQMSVKCCVWRVALKLAWCSSTPRNVRDLRQPFGGVKTSGTGREGGEYSFQSVRGNQKNVCIKKKKEKKRGERK